MKRKESDQPHPTMDSMQQTVRKTRRKQNSVNLLHHCRNQNKKCSSSDVPLSSVFNRLFQDVVYIPTDTVPPTGNEDKLLTPSTPRNISKYCKSMVNILFFSDLLYIGF